MGKISAYIPEELEHRLRQRIQKRGDISKIIAEALQQMLEQETPDK